MITTKAPGHQEYQGFSLCLGVLVVSFQAILLGRN